MLKGYLEINSKGEFRLCVSTSDINPVGTRLEKKHQALPDVIYEQAQTPQDPELAIRALKALRRFLNGEEYGSGGTLQFGVDDLPLLGRKKKDDG